MLRRIRCIQLLFRILPIDRMQWIDPARKNSDKIRTKAWMEKASELGWYDYIYGDQVLPRQGRGHKREYDRFIILRRMGIGKRAYDVSIY